MDEKMTDPHLLLSFVLDNSAQMSGEQLSDLMNGFRAFAERTAKSMNLEWELLTFDAFAPMVAKSFEKKEIAPVPAERFPLLGRAATAAAERLSARAEALRAAGETVHRPWMFILSSGFTMDGMEEVAVKLDGMEKAGELLYLPFKFSDKLFTERLQCLDRKKHMIEICHGHVSDFFAFLDRMIERRAALSSDAGIKFSKTDFEGWAEL